MELCFQISRKNVNPEPWEKGEGGTMNKAQRNREKQSKLLYSSRQRTKDKLRLLRLPETITDDKDHNLRVFNQSGDCETKRKTDPVRLVQPKINRFIQGDLRARDL